MDVFFFFEVHGYPPYQHVLTHSFPTRRSSDLWPPTALASPAPTERPPPVKGPEPMSVHVDTARRQSTAALPTAIDPKGETFRTNLAAQQANLAERSEEHTSELQSLMRISYAVFCLKKTKTHKHQRAATP